MLRQILLNGLIESCLTALTALGFTLIYTTTRIFHIAHGAAYVAGAYGCLFVLTRVGPGVPVALVAGALVAAGLGVLIERVVYAPLAKRHAGPLVGLSSSLGTYIVVVNLVAIAFGAENQTLVPGQSATVALWGGFVVTRMQLLQAVVSMTAVVVVVVFVRSTGFGRTILVVRDNPVLAAVTGTDVYRVRAGVLALGSAMAGLAGVLSAIDVGIDPHAGLPVLLVASVAMIVGGANTLWGPIVGALVVGLARSAVIWTISAQWADAVTFAGLVVMLVLRPRGLIVRRHARIEEVAA